jgi:hypothetical protein
MGRVMNTCNKCGRKSMVTPPCPDCGSDDYTDENAKMFRFATIAILITLVVGGVYLLIDYLIPSI